IAISQNQYSESAIINKRINSLAQSNPNFARVNKIADSKSGKNILQLTLGKEDSSFKPGIAIVAGTEGNHPAGTELAIRLAEKLLQTGNDSIVRLLNECIFYIIPCLNPDAHDQYFARLKYERYGNSTLTDAD